jgi:choline dehydrogenase-like flavoprotein
MISPTPDRDLFTDADFIIVGSGCAGATAAWQLTAAGYRVLVVEEGKRFVPAGNDAYEAMQNWYRDGGAMTSIGPDPVPILQGKSLGGGSTINAGIQIPFPEWVWQEWVEQDRRWAERLPWNALMDATAQIPCSELLETRRIRSGEILRAAKEADSALRAARTMPNKVLTATIFPGLLNAVQSSIPIVKLIKS